MTTTEPKTSEPTEAERHTATLGALGAVDAQITAQNGGAPGTGLYTLLDLLARQFLGLPAPTEAWPPTPKAKTAEQGAAQLAAEHPAHEEGVRTRSRGARREGQGGRSKVTTPVPNSRDVTAWSRGIARNMQLDPAMLAQIDAFNGPTGRYYVDPASFQAIPRAAGGGDLNGSAALIFFGQAGTDASQLGQPRLIGSASHLFAGTPDAGAPPTISTAPFLQQIAGELSVTDGNWSTGSAAPVWKNYTWRRNGLLIGGGAATWPLIKPDDIGASFVATVIAVNGFGSGASASNAVTVIAF